MDKIYSATVAITGLSVFAINLHNIPHKKIQQTAGFEKQRLYFKYYTVSMIKGTIYGAFSPISLWIMLRVSNNDEAFKTHIKPCSVYFKDKEFDDD